jgi:hypothetical protein
MTTTDPYLIQLARVNRLRWRALLLDLRASDVMGQSGQFVRALRIQERAARMHLRASIACAALSELVPAAA